MPAIAFHILKIILCSAILFGYYWLALRNKIFHQYNRFYLLASVVISLILPFIQINIWQASGAESTGAIRLLKVVSSGSEYLDEIIVTAKSNQFTTTQIFQLLYVCISLFLLSLFIQTIIKIRRLYTSNQHSVIQNIYLIYTNVNGTPFSFLKYIFWNNNIDINSIAGKQIFKHELAHVKQKHTHDKLFINTILIFLWCNPFYWLIRKELNMIHEFIADKIAVEDSDTATFASMILQATYPQQNFYLTNPFFYSPIKRRLAMIIKNKHSKAGYFTRLLALPVCLFIVSAFTVKTKFLNPGFNSAYTNKPITVIIDAGHGGKDFGAKNGNGTYFEKNVSLELVKAIQRMNKNKNIHIILSRYNDTYVSLPQRVDFAKEKNADLFISIHAGASGNTNAATSGLAVFVAKNEFGNTEKSKILASALINEFKANYQLPVTPNPVQREKGIWVLQANKCPAVLIEAGSINNKTDLDFLQSEKGKESIAMNILTAIEKYMFTLDKKDKAFSPFQNQDVKDTVPIGIFINAKHADTNYFKTDEFKTKALVIVDSKEVGNFGNEYVEKNNANFNTAVIYNPEEAKKIYGDKGKNGVIKLTQKDATLITADTVFFDKKNNAVKLSDNNTVIDGDLSKVLIYIDGKVSTPEQLNSIPSNKISNVTILKGEKLADIIDANGMTALINVSLKADDLPEVMVHSKSPAPLYVRNQSDTVDDKIFTKVENEPEFTGGTDAWKKYLVTNIDPNVPVQEGWKPGKYEVVVEFIVDKEGNISNVNTINYQGTKTAAHCINLIQKGPKWQPASQNGHIVKAYRRQPISFVIQ